MLYWQYKDIHSGKPVNKTYTPQDISVDIKRILSGKADDLNSSLVEALLADDAGTTALFEQFITAFSRGYIRSLDTLRRHPDVLKQVEASRPANEAVIDARIAALKATLQKGTQINAKKLAQLERHGPRRHLQQTREQQRKYDERSQESITFLEQNRAHAADMHTMTGYGDALAKRMIQGLARLPLGCVLSAISQIKNDSNQPEAQQLQTFYYASPRPHNVAMGCLLGALSSAADDPSVRSVYRAFALARKCNDSLPRSDGRRFGSRLLTPSVASAPPDLTGTTVQALISQLPKISAVQKVGDDIEIRGVIESTRYNLAQLEAACPALGKLLTALTQDVYPDDPEFAALFLRGTVRHWTQPLRRLPDFRDAYIDHVSQLEKLEKLNGAYRVYARVHTVEQLKDGTIVAQPPFAHHFTATKDWLNTAYPGSVKRLSIGENLGLSGKELRDYAMSDDVPAQTAELPRMDMHF